MAGGKRRDVYLPDHVWQYLKSTGASRTITKLVEDEMCKHEWTVTETTGWSNQDPQYQITAVTTYCQECGAAIDQKVYITPDDDDKKE